MCYGVLKKSKFVKIIKYTTNQILFVAGHSSSGLKFFCNKWSATPLQYILLVFSTVHCKLGYTELQLICELSYSYSFFLNQPAAVRSASTLTFHESVSWAWKQRPSSPWLLLAKSASSEHTRALYGKNTEQPKLSGPGLIWFAVRKQQSLRNSQFCCIIGKDYGTAPVYCSKKNKHVRWKFSFITKNIWTLWPLTSQLDPHFLVLLAEKILVLT